MSTIILLIALLAAGHVEAAEPCAVKLDLAVVVDSSSSVCDGNEPCPAWYSMLEFIKNFVSGLTIGPDDTRVSVLNVGNEISLEWKYNRYSDKDSLLAAIGKIPYKGGELLNLLTAGIFFTELFLPLSGDRPFVPNLVVVLTDGVRIVDPNLVFTISSNKFQAIGIKVFFVCIMPKCPESYARGASSDPKQANVTYFLVDGYDNLKTSGESLLKQSCAI